MSTRTITGNLDADPEVVQAGSINITRLRIIENTGEYRQGKWQAHPDTTTHFVEAKFELGENTAATLHKGDLVVVVGDEHTSSCGAKEPSSPVGSSTPARSPWTSTVLSGRSAAQARPTTAIDTRWGRQRAAPPCLNFGGVAC